MKRIILAVLLVVVFLFLSGCAKVVVEIPHAEKIENAISVAGATNTIVKIERAGLFGSGVGVGIGSPQITCKTEDQFLELIPDSSKIYTAVELVDACTVARKYFAVSEKEGLVFVYRILVTYGANGRARLSSFNDKSATFWRD